MLGNRFYNQSFRKLIIAFGQVFNNIIIQRTNSTGGVTARIKVPLAYAPKEKFLVRLDQQANLNSREFATSLPRMDLKLQDLHMTLVENLLVFKNIHKLKQAKMVRKQILITLLFLITLVCNYIFLQQLLKMDCK